MKKMLYCMHIGWNWIKQRPHFIAEELANHYDLTVISNYTYRQNKRYAIAHPKNFELRQFYKIPLIDHYKGIRILNVLLKKIYYSYIIKINNPDYIYVMSPSAVRFLPQTHTHIIIYDCMDDMVEFTSDVKEKKKIFFEEKKLIELSHIVIVSSEHLRKCLIDRYPVMKHKLCTVVKNGFNGDILSEVSWNKKNGIFTICYFGTIAEWFNFDFILRSLEAIPDIYYLLIGPLQSGCSIPQHERIIYTGTVKHEELENAVSDVDAFMMPFILTKLIESVDPVKLYEYINFNRNIICVEYPEVKRFERFVFFYNEYDSFITQIEIMKSMKTVKYGSEERKKFLSQNTWKQRKQQIVDIIDY